MNITDTDKFLHFHSNFRFSEIPKLQYCLQNSGVQITSHWETSWPVTFTYIVGVIKYRGFNETRIGEARYASKIIKRKPTDKLRENKKIVLQRIDVNVRNWIEYTIGEY